MTELSDDDRATLERIWKILQSASEEKEKISSEALREFAKMSADEARDMVATYRGFIAAGTLARAARKAFIYVVIPLAGLYEVTRGKISWDSFWSLFKP